MHGNDEAKVNAELCQTVEEWVETILGDGGAMAKPLSDQKQFSGKFVLRIDPALHRRIAAKALASGESLNSYCAKVLAKC